MTMNEFERVVADTSVVSILARPEDPRYSFYREALDGIPLSISFQTVEERWYGAYNRDWGEKRMKRLEAHLARFDVVWPDETLVGICAQLRSRTRKAGNELAVADAWIASTAMMLGCPLAADNGDFSHVQDILGLPLIQYPG